MEYQRRYQKSHRRKFTVVNNYNIDYTELDVESVYGFVPSDAVEISVCWCHDGDDPSNPDAWTTKSHRYDDQETASEALTRIIDWAKSQ